MKSHILLFHPGLRGVTTGLLVICFLVVSAFSILPSVHAATQAPATAKHCVMVVDQLHPGERTSRVLSYQCATRNQQLQIPAICIGTRTLIMSWYVDANYNGGSTLIYGCGPPCDSAGYGIAYVGDGWNDRISSFKVWNNCFYTRAYTNINYGGTCQRYHNNVSYVGSTMNDRISSFWVNLDVHYC